MTGSVGVTGSVGRTGSVGVTGSVGTGSVGTGPVDAAFRAIDSIVKVPNTLVEYAVHAVTAGIDALGEVTVRISPVDDKRTFGGYGAEPDIVVASIKAYMAAINRMLAALGYGDVKPEGDAATVGISGD